MKKVFKWISITFALIISLVAMVAGIAVWFVFTPAKITPIVRSQAAKYISCESQIGEVELTFFSTFPRFGLKVNHFALINHISEAPSDTLVRADQFVGIVDLSAWWKRNELLLNELQFSNGTVNAFVDSLGRTNFDIVRSDTVSTPADSEMPFRFINIENIELENINVSYIDQSLKLRTTVRNLKTQFSGKMISDTINTNINVSEGLLSLDYEGVYYLRNVAVKAKIPAKVILSKQFVEFGNSEASVNNLSFTFHGTVENETLHNQMITNLDYQLKSWPIPELLALVPPSYSSYLKDVKSAEGFISSNGKIMGAYSDSLMPLMDIHLVLEDGTLNYAGFPVPLSQINGDVAFYSDLKDDELSYLRIDRFNAKTPNSSIQTSGKISHLFTDINCNLSSDGDLLLSEFKPMIPADMKMVLNGRVSGQVLSLFSMSQLEKMQLEKMKIAGSVKLTDFSMAYDTLSLQTKSSEVDFAMPNLSASSKNTHFVRAKINSKNLSVSMLNGTSAYLKNGLISLETSDFRDSTRIPEVTCTFKLDSLSASMDTIRFAVQKPFGQFEMMPQKEKLMEPEINLTFNSGNLSASLGSGKGKMKNVMLKANVLNDPVQPKMKIQYSGENLEMAMGPDSARMNKIVLNADVVNDKNQKDAFLQWQAKGFVNIDKGIISLSSLSYPLGIPSIQMDFNPEVFHIKESKLKIDKSDFSLSGTLSNVISYFRKDSLLRGDFNFVSSKTDVLQLMQLTSGLGDAKGDSVKPAQSNDASGPYMVPKGMDMLLNVDIGRANYGSDVAKEIKGKLRIKDGLLVLDDFTFTSPAAKMQLTAMYRTPRKNHLFMGIDFHMLDVEIVELLKVIPDVDSIMPMLRSFSGKGEYHMAVETYLDSLYNPKKSTIRGAASIKGQNLVLMDGETFSEIAKTLRFSKKTFNKVDSLSAEFTIFKQEIDVYPFLIVMDKYKGVVAGRHNMDLSFDYHISVVDSPLPLKFGIDITGTMDNMKYRLAKCRYAEFYRPAARGEVQNRQLELRRMIREALMLKL